MKVRSDEEVEKLLMLTLKEPYIEFRSAHPEGDRQKIYRVRKRLSEEAPLLWTQELIVRVKDREWIVLEWKDNESGPLEINTERPLPPLEIKTAPKPKKPTFKLPKWLELRRADFAETQATAARLAIDDPKEYLGGWQDLDTLIIACDRLAELLEQGLDDPLLERFIRFHDKSLITAVFMGEQKVEHLDPIEILRRQIAEIPTDDPTRDDERLKLIERRERLMLERDIRLQSTNPLI